MCTALNQALWWAGKWWWFLLWIPCTLWGISKKKFSKVGYVFFSFFWVSLAFTLLFTAKEFLDWAHKYIHWPEGGTNCMGTSAIFRMSFVLMVFHIFVLVMILPKAKWSAYFHDGLWALKFAIVFISFILSLFIPNGFFKGYGWFSFAISFLFLIFQGLILIGFSYSLNKFLMDKAESGKNSPWYALLGLTIFLTLLSVIFIILEFVWYSGWWDNNIYILIPVFWCVVYVILVILKTRESASLFTTSVIVLYLVYLTWSALQHRPESWNDLYHNDAALVFQIVLALAVTFMVMVIYAVGAKSSDAPENRINRYIEGDQEEEASQVSADDEKATGGDKKETQVYNITTSTIIFHAFMIVVSIYYWMLISNWGRPAVKDDDYDYFISEWAGFWVKLVAEWVVALLYFLSLIAPKIFRNREFD